MLTCIDLVVLKTERNLTSINRFTFKLQKYDYIFVVNLQEKMKAIHTYYKNYYI